MSQKEDCVIELHCTKQQLELWTKIANKMCLNIYEYIRRCTDAHTNILVQDFFHLVDKN